MADLLFIVHSPNTTVGTAQTWCEMNDVGYDIVVAESLTHESLPQFRNYRAAIVFGGDMEVWQEEKFPWLKHEKALIRDYINRNHGVFGICLGSQLLAEALGAKVVDMGQWEFGWFPVDLADNSLLVPLHCHSSKFELPPGSTMLATDRFDVNQGFSVRRRYVGFQFHVEIDEGRLDHILSGLSHTPEGRSQTADEIRIGYDEYGELLKNWFFRQLDRWWETVKRPRRLPPRMLHRV